MSSSDPRTDADIAKSAPFAQPILEHIRAVVHEACPHVEETIRWGFPHFDYHGIMCSAAWFKAHCALNFWLGRQVLGDEMSDNMREQAMGQFGRITSVEELPNNIMLKKYIKRAMALNDADVKVARRPRPRLTRSARRIAANAASGSPRRSATRRRRSGSRRRSMLNHSPE